MPTMDLTSHCVPKSLIGPTCVDSSGAPRFWPTIYTAILRKDCAPSTAKKSGKAIDALYETAQRSRGSDCLDRLIANLDFEAIEGVMMAHHSQLRQDASIRQVDNSRSWHYAATFIIEVLKRAGIEGRTAANGFQTKLFRLEDLHKSLTPASAVAEAKAPPLRALPADTLEDIYEITNPYSTRNPFFSEDTRYRNANIVALGMEGFRRGEMAGLRTDALHFGIGSAGKQLAWVNIVENDLAFEERADAASLKSWASVRQVPVRLEIGEALLYYEQNYRGDCCHPYFLSSREKLAIGKRTINHVFETISKRLSPAARAALERQGWSAVTPHMLRHTAAVVLLKQLKDRGETIEDAQAMLRVRFGWVKKSDMPAHYGRAFFEGRLESVVGEIFEGYVATLRKVRP